MSFHHRGRDVAGPSPPCWLCKLLNSPETGGLCPGGREVSLKAPWGAVLCGRKGAKTSTRPGPRPVG